MPIRPCRLPPPVIALMVQPPFGQACAGTAANPSFLLTGTHENFGSHFPGYMANGYFPAMTSPRAIEANRGCMVAFMDYGKRDIARPAMIPAWNDIDCNPGDWLNAS